MTDPNHQSTSSLSTPIDTDSGVTHYIITHHNKNHSHSTTSSSSSSSSSSSPSPSPSPPPSHDESRTIHVRPSSIITEPIFHPHPIATDVSTTDAPIPTPSATPRDIASETHPSQIHLLSTRSRTPSISISQRRTKRNSVSPSPTNAATATSDPVKPQPTIATPPTTSTSTSTSTDTSSSLPSSPSNDFTLYDEAPADVDPNLPWWYRWFCICTRTRYALHHAWREASKRKFNYCLGTGSVFIVVLISAICYTMIARAPVVFLQQAEADNGQYDMLLKPAQSNTKYINYTRVADLTSTHDLSYHSPRTDFRATIYMPGCFDRVRALGIDPEEKIWRFLGPQVNLTETLNSTSAPKFSCNNASAECMSQMCGDYVKNNIGLYLFDTARENRMGLGRMWTKPMLGPGQVYITSKLARETGLKKGDRFFYMHNSQNYPLIYYYVDKGIRAVNGSARLDTNTSLIIDKFMDAGYARYSIAPFTVMDVVVDTRGKYSSDIDTIMMAEYQHFMPYILQYQHPHLDATNVTWMREMMNYKSDMPSRDILPQSIISYAITSQATLYEYSSSIVVSLPPSRIEPYMDTNYDTIQDTLIKWSGNVMYSIGYTEISAELPILSGLSDVKFFSLYLGLILSVILTILFILATMLIYSLLMISIETRTFELGVHRMIGMGRWGVIKLLITQAASYAIPAWVLGLIVAQIGALVVLRYLENSVEVPIDKRLTGVAIGSATALGLLCPIAAAVFPIRNALKKNLHDTIDTKHSKTVGVSYSIERSEDTSLNIAWFASGLVLVIIGFLIYYLLPMSLLTFNLALFFNLFFGLLLGMLFGLILLSLNFEHLVEVGVVWLFFFWEHREIPFLVLKNLTAHRMRNRKTTIMYALALGFIIFITVAYDMQIQSARARTLKRYGAPMNVYARDQSLPSDSVPRFEKVLLESPIVSDFAWVSVYMGYQGEYTDQTISNLGHAFHNALIFWSVSPNFWEVADQDYLIQDDYDTSDGLSLGEKLYTIRGSQSAILPTSTKSLFGLSSLDRHSSFLFNLQNDGSNGKPPALTIRQLKPYAFLDSTPVITQFSRFPSQRTQHAIVSFDTYIRLSGGAFRSVSEIPMSRLLIRFNDQANNKQMDQLSKQLQDIGKQYDAGLFDYRNISSQLEKSNAVMNIIFSIATYIAMFLCLFSLMASMYTNIYEQSKEIAILRAMGLRRNQIVRIYVYEAFTLVLAASFLGVVIGFIMSWTMMAQQTLFTQLPVPFTFPWTILALVVIGAVICSLLSSFAPSRMLVKKSVSAVMRTVL